MSRVGGTSKWSSELGVWPREESNLRTQVRSLPLYPLSYGAARGQYAPRSAAILCASRWR